MSWRTVVVSSSAKLDLQLGYLTVRAEETKKIHISEIAVLVIESTAVSLTAALLAELTKQKVKVIFCDERRNPLAELLPYYGSHDSSGKIRSQIAWPQTDKTDVWTEIVREKILQQVLHLLEQNKTAEADLLQGYLTELLPGDRTNREGHAAKVYFNALFGMEFSRSQDNSTNAALNYGYAIILSVFTREIAANGYLTQLGLFHDNLFNPFNLACDLMEPFRILVDRHVRKMLPEKFEHDEKMQVLSLLQQTVLIDGKEQTVLNAARIYAKSVFDALNEKDISKLCFYRL